jgi:hypothetical protein
MDQANTRAAAPSANNGGAILNTLVSVVAVIVKISVGPHLRAMTPSGKS